MIYSYAYFDKFGNEHSLAGNNVQLPSGDPDKDYAVKMKGYVTDQYGAKSDISFTVRVRPHKEIKTTKICSIININALMIHSGDKNITSFASTMSTIRS